VRITTDTFAGGIAEVSTRSSTVAEAKDALAAIAAEADELQHAVGGSITDAVAGWLAPQYALAARDQLDGLQGEARMRLLRAFVQDWALLRQGDQTAEGLRIDRERLAIEERNSEGRWKRKAIVGSEVLFAYVKQHPKAKAAFDALVDEVRHPFDPTEQGPLRP
jgi:hypothetical protein